MNCVHGSSSASFCCVTYSSMIGIIISVSFVVYNFVSLFIRTLSFLIKQFAGFHYFYREAYDVVYSCYD